MKTLSDMTEPELRETLKCAADEIRQALPAGSMFVLLACDERSEICQYIANIRRDTTVQFLRETADRLERKEDVPR